MRDELDCGTRIDVHRSLLLRRTMSMSRAPPVKVEGFQELMGGDSSMKHDSEENKLLSPQK